MMTTPLDLLESVRIDLTGKYKYLVLRIVAEVDARTEIEKVIIRGSMMAQHHLGLIWEVGGEIRAVKAQPVSTPCVGIEVSKKDCRGGWIEIDSGTKTVRIFGTSGDFGRADHAVTAEAIRSLFPGFSFEVE